MSVQFCSGRLWLLHQSPRQKSSIASSSPSLLLESFPEGPHTRRLLVLVQVGLEGESLPTATARERLVAAVGLHVGSEIRLVGEGLVANGAAEGFFT